MNEYIGDDADSAVDDTELGAEVTEFPDVQPPGQVLTVRQRKILQVIRESVVRRGYPPSVREIGDAVGLKSPDCSFYRLTDSIFVPVAVHRVTQKPAPPINHGLRQDFQ